MSIFFSGKMTVFYLCEIGLGVGATDRARSHFRALRRTVICHEYYRRASHSRQQGSHPGLEATI